MDELIARSNIYALLSRIMLQELESEILDTIINDKTILEFLPHWNELLFWLSVHISLLFLNAQRIIGDEHRQTSNLT